MPSARQIEIDEPLEVSSNGARADLHSLLRELHASNASNLTSLHGRGEVLFGEGESVRGVYILRTGRATVSIASSEGRVVILRIAQVGDVLGLSSVLRGPSYNATVKTIEACRTQFISRVHLMEIMERSQSGANAISHILSRELTELTDRARSLLLPQTANARLAQLLLEWCERWGVDQTRAVRIEKNFTQEEIAQMICSSRETVTRLLSSFTRRNIIRTTSNSILICDRTALETIACG
jgi:CRP/FNR family transcriptional regulator, cyclic AMP receptor protein